MTNLNSGANNYENIGDKDRFKTINLKDSFKDIINQIINNSEIKISDIAKELGLYPVETTLPNGKIIKSINFEPKDLEKIYLLISSYYQKMQLGKNDSVNIDGVCPGWMLSTIAHALHPVNVTVSYPQGGPEQKTLPIGVTEINENGYGEDLKLKVEEKDKYILVSFELLIPAIDVYKTLQTLVAPEIINNGKPVVISGRGPSSILVTLAETYAHKVPAVACFQPGVGNVISISHNKNYKLGDIIS